MTSANWFVGFPIAETAEVARAIETAPSCLVRLAAEDLHATLAFFGGVSETQARAGWRIAVGVIQSLACVEATLGAVVPMGGPHRWSVLAALFDQGRDALANVMSSHRAAILEAAGGPTETRAPKPHVTLARIGRRASERDRALGLSWASSVELLNVRVRLDRLALYTWSENRSVRRFRIVEDVTLLSR